MEQKTTAAGKLALRAGLILLGLLFAALMALCQSPRAFFGERELPAPVEQTERQTPEGEDPAPAPRETASALRGFGLSEGKLPTCKTPCAGHDRAFSSVFRQGGESGRPIGKTTYAGQDNVPSSAFRRCEEGGGEQGMGAASVFSGVVPAVCLPAESSAVVLERDSLRVLYEQNAYLRRPMASTTKIVTALVALEHCPDLDRKLEIPASAVGIEGSSVYLRAGEHLSMRELLYGLMLRSGNDCAVAVAELTAGSVENFVLLMNRKVADLRCTDTRFCNPHGLHEAGHYTTAYDLAVLTAAAMKNPVFREIAGAKRAVIANEGMEHDRVLINKNKLLNTLPGATGVKTGFTRAAGRCLAAACEREGMECVSVVLNCGPMWEASRALLEEACESFKQTELLTPYEAVGEDEGGAPLFCRERFCFPLRAGEAQKVSFRLETGLRRGDPGDPVGKIKIYLGNDLIFSAKLYTMEEIEPRDFFSALLRVLRRWRPD